MSNRTIRFNDSMSNVSGQIYRQDTLLEDYKEDDVFAVLDGKHIDIYAKEAGSSKFKNKMSGKYMLEGNRYIVLYKFIKASGGISQVGIDKEGRLIMQVSSVIEHKAPGRYISYYAVVNQLIYERVQ